jgi:hypothetical protein
MKLPESLLRSFTTQLNHIPNKKKSKNWEVELKKKMKINKVNKVRQKIKSNNF